MTAQSDDSLTRSARNETQKAWLRAPIVLILAAILALSVGWVEGLVWLALMLGCEAFEGWRRRLTIEGASWPWPMAYLGTVAISLLWVGHALLLWRVGDELSRVIALMDLFTVSIYAAIGAHKNRPLMLCLMAAPLTALSALLINYAWATAYPMIASLLSIATLGTCLTILANGLAMNRTDRELADANQALAELAQAARAANAAKDAFLANMSHEIRTPLNGVIGIAAALTQTRLNARQREMVELIHASGDTLQHLLSDMLDLSKIEAGKLDVNIESVDLKRAIETAAHLFRLRADDKGVGFKIRYGPTARGMFNSDATRLRQIVSNLVSNAVKFTNVGEVSILIDVAEGRDLTEPCAVRIEVRDTGVGFDEAVAKRLFQRFEQADGSITREFGGTGLGLSICKALVTLMGGVITARSTPGQGSQFEVTLMMTRSTSLTEFDSRAAPVSLDVAPTSLSLERSIHVLLAEDNEVNQQVVSLMLEPLGATLAIAENGAEALEAFKLHQFDVVLMDMQMPVMDGLAATRAIREFERNHNRSRTPIAMVSANAMASHIALAIDAGCDLHLPKPITPASLAATLTRALAVAASQAPNAAA